MSCPDLKKIELFVKGKLSEKEAAELDSHFGNCDKCRLLLEDVRENEPIFSQIGSLLKESSVDAKAFTEKDAQALLPKRYHVVTKIAHGGTSHVFKAAEEGTGRWVAIKFLPQDANLDEARWNEARLMSGLENQNITTIYLADEKDGVRYIVMEWIEGIPLTDACLTLPLTQKVKIYLKVLEAISFAHEKNIVHRDIKPSNILLHSDNEPKILDFGISVEHHNLSYGNNSIFRGSPPYSAPEQIPPIGKITCATDVFSLGILLYQLLTDELPFPQTDIHELFSAIQKEQPVPLRDIKADIPEALERICLKALEKDPKKRYPNAHSLAQDIKNSPKEKGARQLPKSASGSGYYISGSDLKPFELPLAEGDKIGNYRIVRQIGKSTGIVYQAREVFLDFERAVKILISNNEKTEEAFQQLRRECLARDTIYDSSHIIKSYEPQILKYDGLNLILLPMEYANGGSLYSWLGNNKNAELRISEGMDMFIQACCGIQAIHNAGLVHLDIKPENFMLCTDNENITVKVTDFGISRSLEELVRTDGSDSSVNSGTLPYMSPEQIQLPSSLNLGKTSDIYSLGIVLFEILDGNLPFQGNREELTNQHINVEPPKLDGDLKSWQPIIEKCLAKNPDDRYSGVEELIKDVDNLRRGFPLSVVISCPDCGHINHDQKLQDCEECSQDLPQDYFRQCHRCSKNVRLDLEDCPHCHKSGVAAYYLLKERMRQVEILKDEDPIKAVELLELVFRDGPGEHSKRAEELIADLNQKQKEINDLEKKANKFEEAGKIEESIQMWRKVVNIIPRHIRAIKRIEELTGLQQGVKVYIEKAASCMNAAKFAEAENFLQSCLKLVPNQHEVLELLKDCRERAEIYSIAFNDAVEQYKQKMFKKAQANLTTALKQAPESQEAISLSNKVAKACGTIKELLGQSRRELLRAEFSSVEEKISIIEQTQPGNVEVLEIKNSCKKTKGAYNELVNKIQRALKDTHLSKAADLLEKALVLCPDSTWANSARAQVKNDQSKVDDLFRQAESLIKAANFEKADSCLKQAEEIWSYSKGINKVRDSLEHCQRDYENYVNIVNRSLDEKDLYDALGAAISAKEICPDSFDMSQSIKSIRKRLKEVESFLGTAEQMYDRARFKEAQSQLEQARQICLTSNEVNKFYEDIPEISNKYDTNIKLAREHLSRKRFQHALYACQQALDISSESDEAKLLRMQINGEMSEAQRRAFRRKEIIRNIFKGIISVLLLIIVAPLKGLQYLGRSLPLWGRAFSRIKKPVMWLLIIAGGTAVITAVIFGIVMGGKWLLFTPPGQGILLLVLVFGAIIIGGMKRY